MSDRSESLGRREFVQGSVSAVALAALPAAVLATDASADKAAVLAQIPKMHAANIKRKGIVGISRFLRPRSHFEGGGIHTVAQASWLRAIVEEMAQMSSTAATFDFDSLHAVTLVL